MTATAPEAPPREHDPLELRGRTLPAWAPWAVGAAAVVLTILLFAGTSAFSGTANGVVLAAVLFAVLLTAVSFSVEGRRKAVDRAATTVIYGCFLIALVPLISLLYTVISKGGSRLNGTFLTHSLRNIGPTDTGGGVYHGIMGTLEQGAMTCVFAIPIAILVAVYLVEYAGRSRLGRVVTFFVDVMTGIPSIVAGLFIFTIWIVLLKFQRAGFPAALALAILMIPTVVRSTEEMLKLVPMDLREAAYALGVPKWRTILRVVIPTALPGIITGIMLGVARVIGETAPLLLLVGATDSINTNLFKGPQEALPLIIFDQAGRPNAQALSRAWGAALTLIILVMLLNLVARVIARFTRVR